MAAFPGGFMRRSRSTAWIAPTSGALAGVAAAALFLLMPQAMLENWVWQSGLPALIAVAAYLMGERVSRASWTGVAAATIGAALIAGKPGGAGSAIGIALSLASLLIFLAWRLALKRVPPTRSAMAVPAVTLIVATATVLPVALVLHGAPPLAFGPVAWGGIVGQGLLSTFLATAAWQYGASRVDSASAGVFINIEPLMGAVIGIGLFGDPAGWPLLLGGVLIVAGSVIVVRGERPAAAPVADAIHATAAD